MNTDAQKLRQLTDEVRDLRRRLAQLPTRTAASGGIGCPYIGHYDTAGELPTATEPCFATVGANFKLYYGRVGVAWGCISDIV